MSTLSKTIVALPIAVLLLAGAAMAQSQSGGGSTSSGEGANAGVAAPIDCLTGAYCPPNRMPPSAYNDDRCDQTQVRVRVPGTNRYRIVNRCQWDRWGY